MNGSSLFTSISDVDEIVTGTADHGEIRSNRGGPIELEISNRDGSHTTLRYPMAYLAEDLSINQAIVFAINMELPSWEFCV